MLNLNGTVLIILNQNIGSTWGQTIFKAIGTSIGSNGRKKIRLMLFVRIYVRPEEVIEIHVGHT